MTFCLVELSCHHLCCLGFFMPKEISKHGWRQEVIFLSLAVCFIRVQRLISVRCLFFLFLLGGRGEELGLCVVEGGKGSELDRVGSIRDGLYIGGAP